MIKFKTLFKKSHFSIGDKVKVIANTNGHNYEVDDVYVICNVNGQQYQLKAIDGDFTGNHVTTNEIIPIEAQFTILEMKDILENMVEFLDELNIENIADVSNRLDEIDQEFRTFLVLKQLKKPITDVEKVRIISKIMY